MSDVVKHCLQPSRSCNTVTSVSSGSQSFSTPCRARGSLTSAEKVTLSFALRPWAVRSHCYAEDYCVRQTLPFAFLHPLLHHSLRQPQSS